MQESDKPQFVQLLTDLMGSYAKSFPEKIFFDAWWRDLGPFPLLVIAKAMLAYKDEDAKFAPAPVAIAKLCKLMDGRPNPEEAWAIALKGQDEADTVVWTQEIAEAFHASRLVLESAGGIAARKTFTEIYTRLIAVARSKMQPAKWSVSLGTDKDRQEAPLLAAVTAGLLPAPAVAALLPYSGAVGDEQASSDGLAKVKTLMLSLEAIRNDNEARRQQADQLARDEVALRKLALQEQSINHE